MSSMPHELALGDVYLSPLVPVFSVALLAAWVSTIVLNKFRMSRYIMFPSATFLTLMLLYVLLMNAFWIRI
jgi:Ca2+/Na+ antiporter